MRSIHPLRLLPVVRAASRVMPSSPPRDTVPAPAMAGAHVHQPDIGALHEVHAAGRPMLVVFWSPDCPWALDAASEITKTVARLRTERLPVAVIVPATLANAATEAARVGLHAPLLRDAGGSATRAFDNVGTPQYYVLDGAGRIRFTPSSPEEALLQLAALR